MGGLPTGTVNGFSVHPTNPKVMYVAMRDGIFRSDNAGGRWTRAENGSRNVAAVAINPKKADGGLHGGGGRQALSERGRRHSMDRSALSGPVEGSTVLRRVVRALGVAAFLVLGGASMAMAQSGDEGPRKEIETLKQEQAAIGKELAEIQEVLRGLVALSRASAVPGDVLVAVQSAPTLGHEGARVTIVEFSDYQCPFCRRHSSQVLPELVKEYGKTGKVRYVFRDFPIASLHPQAHRLHEAAHCAGDQRRYWEMHDRLFDDSQRTDAKDLVTRARTLGLDGPRFERCVTDGVHAAKVRQGIADGEKARVRGTPTFFLGLTEPDDAPIRSRRLVVGAQPYSAFKQAIDSLLAEKP